MSLGCRWLWLSRIAESLDSIARMYQYNDLSSLNSNSGSAAKKENWRTYSGEILYDKELEIVEVVVAVVVMLVALIFFVFVVSLSMDLYYI